MRRFALVSTFLVAAVAPRFAHADCHHADDDWEVGGTNKVDECAIAAYKAILAKNPHDGDALAKLLRWSSAKSLTAEYTKKLAKNPDDYATLVILGRLAQMQNDSAAALDDYTKAAAASKKDDAALLVDLAGLQRDAGKLAEAKDSLDKALAAAGSKKDLKKKALRGLADLAIAGNDIALAKTYFEQYIALEPKNAQLQLELGDALLQAQKYDDAIAVYDKVVDLYKGDKSRQVEVVMRVGQALEGAGKDDDAVVQYRKAIDMVPKGHYVEGEATTRIIDIYRRKQDLPTLIAYYEKKWSEKSRGYFEWATLGQLYEESGAGDKAVVAYKKAVAKSPWELETQAKLISLLENVGREDEAIKQYEIVVKVAPSEARFQLDLARRYERRNDLKKALAVLKHLDSSFPNDPSVQSALADLYQEWGKDDLATAAYEKLAKLEPDDPSHLVVLGEQYWNKGDKSGHDKALAIWKRIVDSKHPTAAQYAKLGDTLSEHGMQVDALAHYAKAIGLDKTNFELYKGRAAIYESQKQWAEAMSDWETGIKLLGNDAKNRSTRRDARRHIVSLLTRWGAKEQDYRNKWARDFKAGGATGIDAGYYLVEYFQRRPATNEPKTTLEKLRTMVPDDQDVIDDLVKAYQADHEWDKAVALLLELEKLAPQRKREIYTKIAAILTDEGKHDEEAIDWAKKAIEVTNSKDPIAWQELAERYRAMQRTSDAIAAYEQSLQLDRTNYKATFSLADLYVDSGEPRKAAELYRRILSESSDDETLLKAGKEAIHLEESIQTLGELEKVVAPLTFTMAHKPVFRKILVDLYISYDHYLVRKLRHGSPAERKSARGELDRLGQHGLKPLLEALNDDKDTTQQHEAIDVLGDLGNPGAAAPLIRIALTEPKVDDPARKIGTFSQTPDWQVRVNALIAAGRLGDANVIAQVLPLAKHEEIAMREAAVFTIGRTRDKKAVAPLIEALADHRESVQALACMGLSGIDDAKGIAAMTAVVADGKRHDLARAACAWGLGVRKAKGAITALTTALGDNRGEAQRLAAWALAQIDDKKALPDLIRAYFTRDDDARPVLAWAVAHLAGTAAAAPSDADLTDYPLTASKDGTYDTRAALAHLPGTVPAVGDLANAIPGNETAIAEGIRSALSEHRDLVLAMLDDLDLRDDGLSLGSLLPSGALDAKLAKSVATIAAAIAKDVAAHTGDDDPKVRALAISVGAKIDAPKIDDAIVAGLSDKTPLVRQAAMRAVVTIAHVRGSAPAALRTALAADVTKDDDYQDRTFAVQALGALGKDADQAALIAALADDKSYVRQAAAEVLGRLKATGAIDALLTASKDDNEYVRAATATALVQIGDPRAKDRLAEMAKDDPDEAVRAAAKQ